MQRNQDTATRADPVWGVLYGIGGISAGLFVALLVLATALVVTTPAAPTTGGATTLEYIAGNRTIYIVQQQRWIAYLGIATGILGVASEALRPVIESGYGVYGLLLVWTAAVGWRLFGLAATTRAATASHSQPVVHASTTTGGRAAEVTRRG